MLSIIFLFSLVIFQSSIFCSHLNSILKSDCFIEIRESPYFIDKTLLILKTINNEGSLLLTAPRGFGKSTNLDMMRVFLSNTGDYKVARDIFEGTKIFKDSDFIKANLGNHPVIYCSFQPTSSITDYNTMVTNFQTSLHKACLQHKYLANSSQLAKSDLDQFKKLVDADVLSNFEPLELSSGLYFLSKVVQTHHSKPVILLVDDYDTVILDSILTKSLGIQEVLKFYDDVLSKAIVNNENIKKTILTGTSCILSRLLPSLGTTNCVKFLHDRNFEPFFGLTGDEVDYLMAKTIYVNLRPNITEWYDGYTSPDLSTHIYNTKSLLSFVMLSRGELRSYWKNRKVEASLRILLEDNVRKTLLLDSPGSLMFVVRQLEEISEGLLEGVKNMITGEIWDANVSDVFIHLLMEQGYFTFDKPWERSGYNSSVTFRLANLDVCASLQKFITDYIQEIKRRSSNLNIV